MVGAVSLAIEVEVLPYIHQNMCAPARASIYPHCSSTMAAEASARAQHAREIRILKLEAAKSSAQLKLKRSEAARSAFDTN